VDLVEIGRIGAACSRFGEKFLRRIFSPQEIDYCLRRTNPYPSFAARFAAKEAIAKALHSGFGERLGFTSIAVLTDGDGAPLPLLDGRASHLLRAMGGSRVLLSLSHGRQLAIAQCAVVGDGG
jgi:holo-[acyl-carrier protein] synthase